jgi:hypothetical protein
VLHLAASVAFLFVLGVVLAYQSVLIPMIDMPMIQSSHTLACSPYAFYLSVQRICIDRNEAKVIQDIARLIVPSAQFPAIRGAKHFKILIESVNEG